MHTRRSLADAEQQPLYLQASNERNKRLYLRYGFKEFGQVSRERAACCTLHPLVQCTAGQRQREAAALP